MAKKKRKKKKAKPRDEFMLRLINGATKSGVAKDRKKEKNKYLTRNKVKENENDR